MSKRSRKKSARPPQRSRFAPPPKTAPLQAVTRTHIQELWQRSDAGEELPGEDQSMAQAMAEHPEYHAIFAQGAAGPDEVNGQSPWLHVSMHSVVKQQRQLIPEVDAAITRLKLRGLTEHEAEHRVAELVTRQIWSMLHDKQPYDQEQYLEQLRALGR
jgi:hypothetical protein